MQFTAENIPIDLPLLKKSSCGSKSKVPGLEDLTV